LLRSDGLILLIEEELLGISLFDISSNDDVVSTDAFNNSFHW
jgi:hypothetical protein